MEKDAVYGWENEATKVVFQAILKLKTVRECEDFFRDLMTLHEIEEIAERFRIAQLLDRDMTYLEIAERVGASTTTVSRVSHWLKHGRGGYRTVLERI